MICVDADHLTPAIAFFGREFRYQGRYELDFIDHILPGTMGCRRICRWVAFVSLWISSAVLSGGGESGDVAPEQSIGQSGADIGTHHSDSGLHGMAHDGIAQSRLCSYRWVAIGWGLIEFLVCGFSRERRPLSASLAGFLDFVFGQHRGCGVGRLGGRECLSATG